MITARFPDSTSPDTTVNLVPRSQIMNLSRWRDREVHVEVASLPGTLASDCPGSAEHEAPTGETVEAGSGLGGHGRGTHEHVQNAVVAHN